MECFLKYMLEHLIMALLTLESINQAVIGYLPNNGL